MSLVRPIVRTDIKGPRMYEPIRDDYRRRVIELKRPRRLLLGDRVSVVFENRHTLTLQIEEMCRTEGLSRDEQIAGELEVYNEMMPTADSLSATLFIELPHGTDPYVELAKLVGLDEHVGLALGERLIPAMFEPGRSTGDKISAVQYLRFPLTADDHRHLATAGTRVAIVIDHPNYRHVAEGGEPLRSSLAADYAGAR
jgi:Protein of unknown function (DUF3501)